MLVNETPASYHISLTRGDPFVFQFTYKENSVAQDLVALGATITSGIKKGYDESDLLAFTVDDSNYTSGIVTLSLTSANTEALAPYINSTQQPYLFWYVKIAFGAEEAQTYLYGRVNMLLRD